jgi:hypothetical protein
MTCAWTTTRKLWCSVALSVSAGRTSLECVRPAFRKTQIAVCVIQFAGVLGSRALISVCCFLALLSRRPRLLLDLRGEGMAEDWPAQVYPSTVESLSLTAPMCSVQRERRSGAFVKTHGYGKCPENRNESSETSLMASPRLLLPFPILHSLSYLDRLQVFWVDKRNCFVFFAGFIVLY